MTDYCFPILSAKDIAAYLRRMYGDHVDITEKDIRSPERKKWQKIYAFILCDCCPHLTPDHLSQLPVTSSFAYPELHEDSMPLFNLLGCMKVLLFTCGINDFRMSDIIAPKPKRLLIIISALLNFMFFQEERFKVYEKLKNENDALQDQREMLLTENEEFKQRINAVKARQAEVEAEIDTILKSIDEWNEKMSVLHQTVTAKQKQSSDAKLMMAELKSNLARYKEEIVKEKEQNNKLAAKIVPSPDRLKGEMERMQRQLVQAEEMKQKLETKLAELTKRHQLLQEREQDADMALRCVEAIQQENDKQKTVLASISNLQEENSYKQTEIKHLDAKIQQLTLQISNKHEKMEKLSIQHNIKVNDKKAALEHLERDLNNIQQAYGEQHSQSQAVQSEIKLVKDQQQEEMMAHQETMTTLGKKYKEMLEALDLYHQQFGKMCQKVIATDET